jgi:hypothetical protein
MKSGGGGFTLAPPGFVFGEMELIVSMVMDIIVEQLETRYDSLERALYRIGEKDFTITTYRRSKGAGERKG